MDTQRKGREINGTDLINYVISKWWLYICVFLIATVWGMIWQQHNAMILTDIEREGLDTYIFQQEKYESMNLYGTESIYMNINPYEEICSNLFIHIMDSEYSNGMAVDLEEMLKNGEFVQHAAEMLDIEEKYLAEVISYDMKALENSNEYICEIFIISSNEEQADDFMEAAVEILERDLFNEYDERAYTFSENSMEKIDENLLLYQQKYYETKSTMKIQLASLKQSLNEQQLESLNGSQTIKENYNIGTIVKIDMAVVVLTCLAVILYFILNDCIYTEKDVEITLGLKPFSIRGKEEEIARQLAGYMRYRGVTKMCCLNESEKNLKKVMMFTDRLKEHSLEIEILSKFEKDYRKSECSNYVVCVKKGKTKLNTLYSLLEYCKEMHYQILGVVIF